MLPNFIGIGAPKAGTTWIFKCLQSHPEIFVADVKETMFFSYGYDENQIQAYEENFAKGASAVAVGEISTNYLFVEAAPERVKKHIPDVRLFVSLRNPIEQIYSHYWHLLRQNFHESDRRRLSLKEAMEKYHERLVAPALYYEHLQRWLQYFDRSRLLIVFYDDICTQPGEVMEKLYSFLEVDNTFIPESLTQRDLSVRRGTSPKSPFMGEVYSLLYDRLNVHIYGPLTRLMGNEKAAAIKEKIKIRETMQSLFYKEGYPEMDAETRELLRDRFAEEIQNLAALTNRDLSHWLDTAKKI